MVLGPALMFALSGYGFEGVAWGVVISRVICNLVMLWVLYREIRYPGREVVLSILGITLSTMIMFASVRIVGATLLADLSPLQRLFVLTPLGAVVYGLSVLVLAGKHVREIIRMGMEQLPARFRPSSRSGKAAANEN